MGNSRLTNVPDTIHFFRFRVGGAISSSDRGRNIRLDLNLAHVVQNCRADAVAISGRLYKADVLVLADLVAQFHTRVQT